MSLGQQMKTRRKELGLSRAALAEKLADGKVTAKYVPCMRLCGKGPNIRWDGVLYHSADEALIRRLLKDS